MPRRGTTTARGYDAAHHAAARKLKADMPDGHPCCRCGRPLYRWQLGLDRHDPRGIDADHFGTALVDGGALPDDLACRSCNRSHGARLGNARRRRHGVSVMPRDTEPRSWGSGTASRRW